MGVEDMQENDSAVLSGGHFARCDLSWFEKNMIRCDDDTFLVQQSWHPVAADKHGPTIIHVHRAIAKKIEVWYRVSHGGKDSVFEKRIEYPEGVDTHEQEAEYQDSHPRLN